MRPRRRVWCIAAVRASAARLDRLEEEGCVRRDRGRPDDTAPSSSC